MTALEIDRYFGQTPCLCGDVSSWHFDCYAGKSAKEVASAYRRVYARIRRRLYRERRTCAVCLVHPFACPESSAPGVI